MALSLVGVLLGACARPAGPGGRISVVGSFYPLAWAAGQVGGARVQVLDLTPPGVEAHDTNLSGRQVAEIQSAGIVLLLGYLGFQPQVEAAARQGQGRVVSVTKGMTLRPSQESGLSADPHVWLDPVLMEQIVRRVSSAFAAVDPAHRSSFEVRTSAALKSLASLDQAYRSGLASCRFTTFVATHQAFGYLAARYGLTQIGIEGVTPEAEPSAGRLRAAETAIRQGRAAPAVFYEGTADGKRIGQSVAADLHVPALPLGTLEFDPAPGNYLSVMRANLASLRRGLQCR